MALARQVTRADGTGRGSPCEQPERPGSETAKRITHRFVAYVIGAVHERAHELVTPDFAALLAQFYGLLRERGYELTEIEKQQHQRSVELLDSQSDGDAV